MVVDIVKVDHLPCVAIPLEQQPPLRRNANDPHGVGRCIPKGVKAVKPKPIREFAQVSNLLKRSQELAQFLGMRRVDARCCAVAGECLEPLMLE